MTAAIALPKNHRSSLRRSHRENGATTDPYEGLSTRDFEVFVRDYADRLLSVARRLLRLEEDAADAVQDSLLSAFAARANFQGDSTVYTWLYRIVVNTCLMKLRTQSRATTTSLDDLLPTFDNQGCHRHPVSDCNDRADNFMARRELRAVVRACIDELPDEYRAVLILRDIEQLDTDQTAELLNVSRGAVKTRLHRARQALRSLLERALHM